MVFGGNRKNISGQIDLLWQETSIKNLNDRDLIGKPAVLCFKTMHLTCGKACFWAQRR